MYLCTYRTRGEWKAGRPWQMADGRWQDRVDGAYRAVAPQPRCLLPTYTGWLDGPRPCLSGYQLLDALRLNACLAMLSDRPIRGLLHTTITYTTLRCPAYPRHCICMCIIRHGRGLAAVSDDTLCAVRCALCFTPRDGSCVPCVMRRTAKARSRKCRAHGTHMRERPATMQDI